MSDIEEEFRKLTENVLKLIQDDVIRDNDSSLLSREHGLRMLEVISKCESWLDILLTQTEEIGGFGSFYPKKCLDSLRTFKIILEMDMQVDNER